MRRTQGANLIPDLSHNRTESARTIASTIEHALDSGADEIEVSQEAEDRWIALLLTGPGRMGRSPDGTPGYDNNERQDPGQRALLNVGPPAGPAPHLQYLDGWRRACGGSTNAPQRALARYLSARVAFAQRHLRGARVPVGPAATAWSRRWRPAPSGSTVPPPVLSVPLCRMHRS